MIPAIKAEFRKLLTVRSTYITMLLAAALVVFYAGYIEGIKADKAKLLNHGLLGTEITGAIGAVSIFAAIIGLLLLAHEYRYNTIMYTLTAARYRSSVLVAKIVAVTCFVLIFTVVMMVLSPLMTLLGVHLHGAHLVSQSIPFHDIIWRCLFFAWGYAMYALIITALIRNQVGAIVILFLVPTTVESILGLLLKLNTKYLPFSALESVINGPAAGGLTAGRSALVALTYIVIGWAVAWFLFLRRDAN